MLDMMKAQSGNSVKGVQEALESATIHIPEVAEELMNDIKNYNEQVVITDPANDLYGDIKPVSNVLVKCYLVSPEVSDAGLVKPFTQTLQVKTKSGHDGFENVELPFLLSTLVKVIAVPDSITMVKPGQWVQVSDRTIQGAVIGQGNNRKIAIANAFTRADQCTSGDIPTDITDPHFGYLLVTMGDIRAIYG